MASVATASVSTASPHAGKPGFGVAGKDGQCPMCNFAIPPVPGTPSEGMHVMCKPRYMQRYPGKCYIRACREHAAASKPA